MSASERLIVVGEVAAPYGVRGWVKIRSFTEPEASIAAYKPWFLQSGSPAMTAIPSLVEVIESRIQGERVLVLFSGVSDRDTAARLTGAKIYVPRSALGEAAAGSYFWVDLIGLEVLTHRGIRLGVIEDMMATGANDVMVVNGERERLIPFVMGNIVLQVDLQGRVLIVDWEPDY